MSRKSTLEKLAEHFETSVLVNHETGRKFVKAENYYVIDNTETVKDTLLLTDGKDHCRVENNGQTFHLLVSAIEQQKQNTVELFGQLFTIEV